MACIFYNKPCVFLRCLKGFENCPEKLVHGRRKTEKRNVFVLNVHAVQWKNITFAMSKNVKDLNV